MRMKAKKAVWDVGHTHQHYRCVLDGLNAWKSKQASSEYKLPVRRKKVERRKIVDRKKLWTTGKGTHSLIRSLDLQVCSMFVGNSLSLWATLFSFFLLSIRFTAFVRSTLGTGRTLIDLAAAVAHVLQNTKHTSVAHVLYVLCCAVLYSVTHPLYYTQYMQELNDCNDEKSSLVTSCLLIA